MASCLCGATRANAGQSNGRQLLSTVTPLSIKKFAQLSSAHPACLSLGGHCLFQASFTRKLSCPSLLLLVSSVLSVCLSVCLFLTVGRWANWATEMEPEMEPETEPEPGSIVADMIYHAAPCLAASSASLRGELCPTPRCASRSRCCPSSETITVTFFHSSN